MNIARGDVWDGVLMLVMMQVLSVACLRFGRNLERALCGCATGSLPFGAWSSALPQRVVCCCSDTARLAVATTTGARMVVVLCVCVFAAACCLD